MSRGSCSTLANHSSASSFHTLRRGASSRESPGRRPPRSGNWASRLASTSLRNQPRSICRARNRLSSCWRWSTSAGGRLVGNCRAASGVVRATRPRLSHHQPKAVPTTAESTRAITTGQIPPSAASSRSSSRVRGAAAGAGTGAGSGWGGGATSTGSTGAGAAGRSVTGGGTRATVLSARGTGPVLSGMARAWKAARALAAEAKRSPGWRNSRRLIWACSSGWPARVAGQRQARLTGSNSLAGPSPLSSTKATTPRACRSIHGSLWSRWVRSGGA